MRIDPPHYHEFYPNMSKVQWNWATARAADMGWMSGLHNIANNSLHSIYGHFDAIQLDPAQPLNFSVDLNHIIEDSHGPIMYLASWGIMLLALMIFSWCWCWCRKCCCLVCAVAKERQSDCCADIMKDSKRFSVIGILLAVIMGVWLLILIFLMRYAFDTTDKTRKVMTGVYGEINGSIKDIDMYLATTRRQVKYTFQTCWWTLRDRVNHILKQCTGIGCKFVIGKFTEIVQNAMDKTSEYLIKHSTELDIALSNVQAEIIKAEQQVKEQYEDKLVQVGSIVYGFFVGFNLLYCVAVFVPILVAVIFLTFGQGKCLRTSGLILLRCAVFAMFLLGIVAVLQVVTLFLFSGVTVGVVCPAIRRLENGNVTLPQNHTMHKRFLPEGSELMKINEYKVPEYGKIIRGCRDDQSAYDAFNLKQAYDVRNIEELTNTYFNIDVTKIISGLMKHVPIPLPLLAQVADKLPPNQLEKVKNAVQTQLANKLPPSLLTDPMSLLAAFKNRKPPTEYAVELRKFLKRSSANASSIETTSELPTVVLNPIETIDEIKEQIKNYTHFVIDSIENDLGRCKPAYMAVNATLNLFCEKVVAPVMSFWWILQFIPPTFILIILTALCIEKLE